MSSRLQSRLQSDTSPASPPAPPALLHFQLRVSGAQAERLRALQAQFAAACNAIAPVVRASRCWHRVALHHLTYKGLRERFPQLGSQMACNVIYSVCRAARIVYQHPHSPWLVSRNPAAPLPLLCFLPNAPVFFDRHTLSLKEGEGAVSMYTLDGRMHFQLDLTPEVFARFRAGQVREIVLLGQNDAFVLQFRLGEAARPADKNHAQQDVLPEYLVVLDDTNPASPTAVSVPDRLIA